MTFTMPTPERLSSPAWPPFHCLTGLVSTAQASRYAILRADGHIADAPELLELDWAAVLVLRTARKHICMALTNSGQILAELGVEAARRQPFATERSYRRCVLQCCLVRFRRRGDPRLSLRPCCARVCVFVSAPSRRSQGVL
jgi:hypothetical protein